MPPSPLVFHGEAAADRFGFSLADAGDVDGDSVSDWIAGAHLSDGTGSASGRAYVYSGATGEVMYTMSGEHAGDWFGFAVAGAGDVDGDGRADVIVGARKHDGPAGEESGKIYVYSGATGRLVFAQDGEHALDHFGFAVAGAGDVDGDGRAELVVGARGFDGPGAPSLGRAYVYSVTAEEPLLFAVTGKGPKNNFLGHSVASAGDVDGDGRADVIVGARGTSTVAGYAEVYSFDPDTGDVHVLHLNGEHRRHQFGHAVAGAGDVDGDGRADVIVGEPGAPGPDGMGAEAGRAYVISGATGSELWVFAGEGPTHRFGTSVSGGRDLDGDGAPDLTVGAAFYDSPNAGPDDDTGQVSAYSGATGERLFSVTGEAPGDRFGYSISILRDASGDGRGDLLVGARDHGGPAGIYSGAAYLYLEAPLLHLLTTSETGALFGSAVAFADVDADGIEEMAVGAPGKSCAAGLHCGQVTLWNWNGDAWVAFPGTEGGTTIEGMPGDFLGFSIANAGRIDAGDGRCDGDSLVIGAPQCTWEAPCQQRGKAHVYCFDGADPVDPWQLVRQLSGDAVGDFFGWAVAGPGNLNGRGNTDDIVVSSPGAFSARGKVVAFDDGDAEMVIATYRGEGLESGSLFGCSLATADVTGELASATEILIGAPGARIGEQVIPAGYPGKTYVYPWHGGSPVIFVGENGGDMFGFSVASAGDLGGPSGREELVVGAPGFGGMRGKAYVFAPDNDTGLLYTLNGRPTIDELVPADAFGYSVRGIGDVDGDGDGDLAVAAPFCREPFCSGKGKVYLYSGDASMAASDHWLRTFHNQHGHARDVFGASLTAAPDLSGDGKADLLVGAPRFEDGSDREQDSGALHSFATATSSPAARRSPR